MLLQFVTVLQGVLAPALLVMALSVMLTVGEGRDKPLSAYWRLAGFVVGFAGAVVFAALRATAVITQRTFVNYPTLWCCVILDVAVFVIVLFPAASPPTGTTTARCSTSRISLRRLRSRPPPFVRCPT